MKLHLPLRLLAALLAVLSFAGHSYAAAETEASAPAQTSVSGTLVLEEREYRDENFSASGEDVISSESDATLISGTSSITLTDGGAFNMSAGTLGYGADSTVSAGIGSGSVFTISGGKVAADSGARVTFDVASGGSLIFSGTMNTGAGVATINVNGGTFEQSSSITGASLYINVYDGGVVTQDGKLANASNSKATIVVDNGGTYTLNGLVGELGGRGAIEVKQGGVFNVGTAGRISARNTGSSDINVNGGQLNTSGNVLSSMCSGGTITIQNGGVFTQNAGAVAYDILATNRNPVTVTIKSNGRYQMNGGNFGSSIGSGDKSPVNVDISDGGSFVQAGGVLGAYIPNITLNVTQGGSYTLSGGSMGNGSGVFDFNVQEGGSFTISGGGLILGLAQFDVTGSSTFAQNGGVIKGNVSITLDGTGAEAASAASFTMTDGDILEHVSVDVLQGARFYMDGAEATIGGSAGITVSGATFTQNNGIFGESATLTLSDGATYTLAGGTFSAAALSAEGSSNSISQSGGSMETELTLADGAQYTQSGGSFSGSILASGEGTSITQEEEGEISAEVALSDGAAFNQSGNVTGAISITGEGSTYTQEGGSILTGSSISLSDHGSFVQNGGSIMTDVELNDATVSFAQNGVISGSVRVTNGASYTQNGNISGNVSVNSGSSFTQQENGSISGDVEVDGSGSEFTQGGSISGDVTVSNGAQFNNNHAILGGLTVDQARFTQTSDISGDVTLANGGSITQQQGTTSGGVEVSGSGSSFSQEAGSIEGQVTLNDGSFSQKSGAAVDGGVAVNGGEFTQESGGSILGGVVVAGGSFEESGAISGAVKVSGGSFTQKGTGVLTGDVTVSGSGSFTQEASGSIAGSITQSGGSVSLAGSITGGVELSSGSFTQVAGAEIGGEVVQSGGSFEQNGDISGGVELSGGSFTQKNGTSSGAVVVTGGSYELQAGTLSGELSVSNGAGFAMSGGSITGSVGVSDGSFTMSGGSIGNGVAFNLLNSTLTLSNGASMAADVTLSGTKSLYDMGGVAASGTVTLSGGNLAQAGSFAGDIVIDTAVDYASSVSVGGAAAERISAIRTRSAETLITHVGNGTLTLSGADHSMVVGTNTSTAHTTGTGVLISFENSGANNKVAFDGTGKLTLNFSTDLILEAARGELEGDMKIHLTDGSINLGTREASEIFIFGAGIAEGVKTVEVQGGNLIIDIDLDNLWIASKEGDVTTATHVETISRDLMVIVDKDMKIQLPAGKTEVTLHQLSGDSTYGNLSIIADAEQTIKLDNTNSPGEANGNTVFNGNITVSGAAADSTTLAKQGDATLTLGGVLSAAGTLDVQGGKLVLNSEGNQAGVLKLASGAELAIVGDLTLSGTSENLSGAITGGGTLIQNGGHLTLGGEDVQANLTITGGAEVTQGTGDIIGDVLMQGAGTFMQAADIQGSVTLAGKDVIIYVGSAGSIAGSLTIASDWAAVTLTNGSIGQGVEISGTDSYVEGEVSVGGNVVISGASSSFDSSEAISGSVELSGKEASLSAGSIGKGATLSGAGATAEVDEITGSVVVSGAGAELKANTSITGGVTLSGAGASVTAQAISGGAIDITGAGSSLKVSSLADSAITLNGAGATLDLEGATANTGKLTIYNGSLTNAGGYTGDVIINTSAAYSGSVLAMGGLNAQYVKNIKTASGISITELAGTLTFTGMDNMLTLGTQHVGVGGSEAETALIQFSGSGTVGFGDSSAVKLQFSDDLLGSFGSGKLELWFTDGTITGMDGKEGSELISWLQTHFLLATGSGVEFAYIESEDGGKLYLTAATRNVWQTSVENQSTLTQVDAFDPYGQVIIDLDTKLAVEATAQSNHSTIKQLQGKANLEISNSGQTPLTVELRNESFYDVQGNMVTHGATSFNGNLGTAGEVNIQKTGNDVLVLNGNLKTAGDLDVKNGKLVLNGKANTAGSLSLNPETPARADGKDVSANELEVNGKLTLSGSSDLSAASGAISGTGLVELLGELTVGADVSLSGPAMALASGSTLDVSAAQGASIGGLSGAGTLINGAGGLTITGGQGVFSGELRGEGMLTLAGETQLTLSGAGNANYDLVNGRKASLTLSTDSATYRTVDNTGVLRIAPVGSGREAAAAGHVEVTDGVALRAGSTTAFVVNFDSAQDVNSLPALLSSNGAVVLESGMGVAVEGTGLGVGMPDQLELTLIHAEGGLFSQETTGYAIAGSGALEDGMELSQVETTGLFNIYYENAKATVVGDDVVFTAQHRTGNLFDEAAGTFNSRAGAALLWAAKDSLDLDASPTLGKVEAAVADLIVAGKTSEATRALAAVAGSTSTAISAAQSDSLRQQLERTRQRAVLRRAGAVAGDEKLRAHAWVEGIGAFAKLSTDGDESGYKLNSWGGSVGADVELNPDLSVGLSLTALYGDLDASAAESASGKMDSYYLSLFLSSKSERWTHTLALVGGGADVSLNRYVDLGSVAYSTSANTSATSLGAIYEVAYDIPLEEQKTSLLQPVASIAINSVSVNGYEETGADGAGLHVDRQTRTSATLALGARYLTKAGAQALGRAATLEFSASVAQELGDTRSETNVALLGNPGYSARVRGAEVGSTAFRLGVSASVPVNQQTQVFVSGNADLRSGAALWGVNFGVQTSF